MTITLNGSTGITTPDIDSVAAPDLVGTNFTSLPSGQLVGNLPAIDGSSITSLSSSSLTGALPAIDGSALTGVGASTTAKAVGTYAFVAILGTEHRMGDTKAASSLPSFSDSLGIDNRENVTAGTWQVMGASAGTASATLMIRIA